MRTNAYYAGACRYSVMSKIANDGPTLEYRILENKNMSPNGYSNIESPDTSEDIHQASLHDTSAQDSQSDIGEDLVKAIQDRFLTLPADGQPSVGNPEANNTTTNRSTQNTSTNNTGGQINNPTSEQLDIINRGIDLQNRYIQAQIKGEEFKWTQQDIQNRDALNQLIAFNPSLHGYIGQRISTASSGWVNKDTNPKFIRELPATFKTMMSYKLPQPQHGSWLQRNFSALGEHIQDTVTDLYAPGVTKLYEDNIMSGLKTGIQEHKPYLYGNYQEWADYAVDQGMLPDWLKPFTKDKFMFWGSLLGVGSLAVGGLTALVRSFLGGNGSDKNQKRNTPNKQSQYNRLLNSTSMWRSM